MKFEDYLFFFGNRHAHSLTTNQLNQEEIIVALSSLNLIPPIRFGMSDCNILSVTTFMSAVSLEEVKHDMREIGWEECPVGSVLTINPAAVNVSENSTSIPTSQKKRRGKANKRSRNDERSDLQSSVAEEGANKDVKEVMSSSRGPCGPTDAAAANNDDFLDPSLSANNFSDLLWMPHDQHKLQLEMDQYKPKPLKFEDYLSFFEDHHAGKLTYSQLNQILFMHGFVKLNSHTKEEVMNAVSSLDLVMPTRSTITSSIDYPMSPLSLVEVQLNIREMEWEECPIGSVMSFKPAGYCAASGNTSSLLTVVSELTGIRTEEKIHYTNAGLVAEPLPVKKTMRLPVGSLKDHDVYSWRGNGTKKKENIVYRWYYRCKTKSCPVRKTVFRDPNDSSMCIITYTGEHNHSIP